jgi:hypothetical protein
VHCKNFQGEQHFAPWKLATTPEASPQPSGSAGQPPANLPQTDQEEIPV